MQGIQTLGPGVADKMAAMGQFEDDQIAHVAEGEVIVPAPIMKYYPEVKEQVFAAIRDQGLEPEQFIVGNEMVAINPNTGVQEFGFLKKVFKKIKKIVKKAAPLLIAAALPGVGSFLAAKGGVAGMLGKGIGALTAGKAGLLGTSAALDAAFKGGNLKDVLKAGATGAAVGAVTQGISNQITGQSGGYFTPATSAPNPTVDAINKGRQQAAASTAKGTQVADASTATGTMTDAAPTMTEYRRMQATGQIPAPAPADQVTQQMIDALPPQPAVPGTAPTAATAPTPVSGGIADLPPSTQLEANFAASTAAPVGDIRSVSFGDAATLSDLPSTANLGRAVPTEVIIPGGGPTVGPTIQAAQAGTLGPAPTPGYFEKIAAEFRENPLPATGTVLSSASLAAPLFMDEEMPEQSDMTVSREELAQMLGGEGFLNYAGTSLGGLYYNPETEQYQDVPYVQSSGIMTAAGGGHIMGPGTGTSDSIPAYLSDGEFVMTADAVKGAGNGDRKKGAAKMYAMMSKFEGQA